MNIENDMDNEMDKILMKRYVPPPATNLASRIIEQARDKAHRRFETLSFSEQLLRLFIIPKPAYVSAFCLVLGLAVGIYSGSEEAAQDWFSFLEMQEEEWL